MSKKKSLEQISELVRMISWHAMPTVDATAHRVACAELDRRIPPDLIERIERLERVVGAKLGFGLTEPVAQGTEDGVNKPLRGER